MTKTIPVRVTAIALAAELGCHQQTITRHARRLGLARRPGGRSARGLTPAEADALRAAVRADRRPAPRKAVPASTPVARQPGCREIGAELGVSRQTILNWAQALGLPRRRGGYTAEEVAAIRAYGSGRPRWPVPGKGVIAPIARALGLRAGSVTHRARSLGLDLATMPRDEALAAIRDYTPRRPPRAARPAQPRKGTMTKRALAAELGIGIMTLRRHGEALGTEFVGPMTDEVIAALRASAKRTMTKRALALELGIGSTTLRRHGEALGTEFVGPMSDEVIAALRASVAQDRAGPR